MTCNKIPYSTKEDALKDIQHIKANNKFWSKKTNNPKNGRKMRVYQCPYCKNYHVTTQKQRKK